MGTQRYDEIVYSVGGIVCREDDCLVLPLVVLGTPVGAVLTHLRQLQAAQRLLLLQQVAEGWAHSDEGGHWRESLHDTVISGKYVLSFRQCFNYIYVYINVQIIIFNFPN